VRLLATLFFYVTVAITLPVGWLVARVMAFFGASRTKVERFVNAYCHEYLSLWPGWRASVRSLHATPAPCVLVANHQSMADILALMGLPFSFYFVSKASLFSVPLIGSMMKVLGHVPLVRGSTESTRSMMERCETLLRAGERVLLFPEGTYAPMPKRLPFRRGAFALAKKLGVPVVPVTIRGAYELVPHDGPVFSATADIQIETHSPVDPAGFADDLALSAEIERQFMAWLVSSASLK
jgi:1-acyl-sn-glycerol-3-phosphate acyltransferase